MRSFWGCCWLVLAWVLLLGHAVSGQEEGYQVAPLEEPDDTVEAGQLEAAEEQEDLQEPEEAVMEQDESEEPEDLQWPEDEEEELENRAREQRRLIENDKHLSLFYRYKALNFMEMSKHNSDDPNADPNAVYRLMEDSTMITQKAYGNIIKFRMFLTKGDCKDNRVAHDDYYEYLMSQRYKHRERSTNCEKLDCVFAVFKNVKNGHEAVIGSDCRPLMLFEEFGYYEDDDMLHDDYNDDYTNYITDGDTPDVSAFDEDTPDMPTSDDDTIDVPISDDDSPPPTSNFDDPDNPASDGDTPDVHTSDDDDAN